MRRFCLSLCLTLLFQGTLVSVAEETAAIQPALAPKPAVLKTLEGLGDNSAVVIEGTVVHDKEQLGDFAKGWHNMKTTGPTARDFTLKMAWMPDRERAFFCGTNHGAPTRFNDAWEYDLPSNTWVMLYVPDYNDRGKITDYDKQVLELKDGWLRTKKGGPAHPAHTWWGLTYDPNLKAAVWYCAWPPYRLQAKLDAIGAKKEDLYNGPPMWLFYPETKKWEPVKTAKPWPRTNAFGASLEYIPELKNCLLQYRSENWVFDPVKKNWQRFPGQVSLPIETLVSYDPDRKLLIAYRGPISDKKKSKQFYRTWHMKLSGGKPTTWELVLETEDASPTGHDARSMMYYDRVGKVVLLYERGAKSIWSYNPDKPQWQRMQPQGAAEPPFSPKERVLGYLDAARNAFVVIGYGKIWCYRYKKQ